MATVRTDDDLIPLLSAASPEDLSVLVDYVTDSGNGRLSLENAVMSKLISAKARNGFTENDRLLLAHEIQLFGGNTLANIARGGQGVPYKEISEDVASRLKIMHRSEDPVAVLENALLETIAARAWEKMTDEEKAAFVKSVGIAKTVGIGPGALAAIIAAIRASGFAAYKFATVVANTVARQLIGRGLAFGATAPFMSGMSVLAGPIGWVVTAIWTAFDLTSPGYRVTVPCVIQIAYMRKKWQSVACSACGALNGSETKFCPECGNRMKSADISAAT